LLLCVGLCGYLVVDAMSWYDFLKPEPKPPEHIIGCVEQAVALAWTWQRDMEQECRIAVQHIRQGTDHAQAQAYVDGEWKPLVMAWTDKGPVARIGKMSFDIKPYRYASLDEWIDEQRLYAELH
jgi:hypothetical protein